MLRIGAERFCGGRAQTAGNRTSPSPTPSPSPKRHTSHAACRGGIPTRFTPARLSTGGGTFTTLLDIPDASALDVATLWAPRERDDELRVPIGVTATGEPLYFDLEDEAEGGMGPHGLMIGMTGSGKSQTLMSIRSSLSTTPLPTG